MTHFLLSKKIVKLKGDLPFLAKTITNVHDFFDFLGYSMVALKSVRVIAALCNDAPRLRDLKEMFRKIIDLCRS